MKTEFLKELGIAEDVISKIMAENGKDIEKHKTNAESLKNELTGVKNQLNEANTQIQSFKDMDIDGIKGAADDYKAKFEKSETENKKNIESLKLDYALNNALSSAKAKSVKAVKAFLDMENLKLNNGEVIGLQEQIEKIKAENDYLFDNDDKQPSFIKSTNSNVQFTNNDVLRSVMGLPPNEENKK